MFLRTKNDIDEMINQIFLDDMSTLIIHSTEKSKDLVVHLCQSLNKIDTSYMGGLFPSISVGSKTYDYGISVKEIKTPFRPYVIQGINNDNCAQTIQKLKPTHITKNTACLTWINGQSSDVDNFVSKLQSNLGNQIDCFGETTSCNNESLCIFSNEGFFKDSAVITFMDSPWKNSVLPEESSPPQPLNKSA